MKKHLFQVFLCLLAVLVLGLSAAFASGVDVKTLTDEEILALLAEVNNEVVSRGLGKTAKVPKGRYIAGKDIPCGSYIYTCMATGNDWGNVTVYSNGGEGEQLLWEVVSAPEKGQEQDSFFVTLHEGDELKSGVPFSLTVSTGIRFE